MTPDSLAESLATGETALDTITVSNTGADTLHFQLEAVPAGAPQPAPSRSAGFYADEERTRTGKRLPELYADLGTRPYDGPLGAAGDILSTTNNFLHYPSGLQWVGASLYVVDYTPTGPCHVRVFDVAGETVVDSFAIHEDAFDIAWDGQYLWVGKGNGTVYGYALNGTPVGSFNAPFVDYPSLAYDGQHFIVRALLGDNTFYKLDHTGAVVATLASAVDGSAYALEWVAGHADSTNAGLWMHDGVGQRNVRLAVDATGSSVDFVSQFGTTGSGFALAHDGVDLWWSAWQSELLLRLDDGLGEGVDWLHLGMMSGAVAPGGSQDVEVTFDATGLGGGDYAADIHVDTDDPVTPRVVVDATLHVAGTPQIAVSDTLLDFGQVETGQTKADSISITNTGNDTLHVSSLSTALPEFAPTVSSLAVPPLGVRAVEVTFSPLGVGAFGDTLSIVSNADIAPLVKVALLGEGIPPPPEVSVSPDSLAESLLVGETSVDTLTISNTGGEPLDFDLSAVFVSVSASPPANIGFYADESRIPVEPQAPPVDATAPDLAPGDVLGTYSNFPYQPTGATWANGSLWVVDQSLNQLSRYDPATQSVVGSFPIHANAYGLAWDGLYFWVGSDNGNVYGYDTAGNNVGSFSVPFSGIPLLAYDGTDFLAVQYSLWVPTTIYRLDHTGAVVSTYSASLTNSLGLAYGMEWVPAHEQSDQGGLWLIDTINGGILRLSLAGSTATVKQAFALPGSPYTLAHDGADLWLGQLQTNTVLRVDDGIVEPPPWIIFSDSSGTIAPSGSQDVEVTFDATGRFGGDYRAYILLSSNDPETPLDSIPASMHVTGVPSIALSAPSLDFGDVFVGVGGSQNLTISNDGSDTLVVSSIVASNSDFSVNPSSFHLGPWGQAVTVTLTPPAPGVYTDSLTITSNDPDSAVVTVGLTASAFDPPVASVVPDTIADTVLAGQSFEVPLRVINSGGYPLNWSLLKIQGGNWLSFSPASGTTAVGNEDTVTVTLDATTLFEGVYTGELWLLSNDSASSPMQIPVSLYVDGEPEIIASHDTLDFGVVYVGYPQSRQFTVTNQGTATLHVTGITPSNGAYVANPNTFTLAPTASQAVTVDVSPVSVGSLAATLLIASDDPNKTSYVVELLGEAVYPPVVVLVPDSLTDSLYTNQTSVDSFVVRNTGASELSFTLSLSTTTDSAASPRHIGFYADETRVASTTEPPRQSGSGVEPSTAGTQGAGDLLGIYMNFPYISYGMAWTDSQLWVLNSSSAVSRYDVETQTNTMEFTAHPSAYGMTWDGQYLWVGSSTGNFYGYDGDGNNVGSFSAPSSYYHAIAFDGQYFLVARAFTSGASIYRLDYSGSVVGTYSYSGEMDEMCWATNHALRGLGGVWTSRAGQLIQLSLSDGVATAVHTFSGVGGTSYAISHNGRDLWLAPYSASTLYRIDDGIDELHFLEMDPVSGIVAAGDSLVVEVRFDATDLPFELSRPNYRANVVVSSNDPATPQALLPAHLHVTAAPWIVASDSLLDFGAVIVGQSSMDTLTVHNNGKDTLHVSGFTTTLPDFVPPAGVLAVPPHDSADVVVAFAPTSIGAFGDTLTITNDAVNGPVVKVALVGEGLPVPPHAVVSPDSLVDSLAVGASSAHVLTISNTGEEPLDFELSTSGLPSPSPSPHWEVGFYADESRPVRSERPDLSRRGSRREELGPQLAAGDILRTYSNYPAEASGAVWANGSLWVVTYATRTVNRYDVATQSVVQSFQVPYYPWGIAWDGEYLWVGRNNGNVYGYDLNGTNAGSFSLPWSYEASLTFDGQYFIACPLWGPPFYRVDHAGAVVDTLTGDIEFDATDMQWVPAHGGSNGGSLWLLEYNYLSQVSVESGTVKSAGGFAFNPTVFSLTHNGSDLLVGQWDEGGLFRIDDGITEMDWVILGDSTGTIQPDSSRDVDVTFSSVGKDGGAYAGNVVVSTNDPDNPELYVPALMHVAGTPNIEVTADSLGWGDVWIGYPQVRELTVINRGTDVLTISEVVSSHSFFTPDTTSFDLDPGDGQPVQVTFAPTDSGTFDETLSISSNDLDSSVVNVKLHAPAYYPPVVNAYLDSIPDTIPAGDTVTVSLRIANTGGYPLNWSLAKTVPNLEWLTFSPTSGTTGPGTEDTVVVTLNTTGLIEATYNGTFRLSTSDPVTPTINMLIEFFLDGDPNVVVSSDTLNFGVVYIGYPETQQLTVTNAGTANLHVTGITPSNGVYAVSPDTFTLAPTESQAVTVDVSPTSVGSLAATLTIESDDPDTATYLVDLLGEALYPPVVSLAPDSLTDSLYTNQTSRDSFVVRNTGASDLSFRVSLSATTASAGSPRRIGFYADETRVASVTEPPRQLGAGIEPSAAGVQGAGEVLGTYLNFPDVPYGMSWTDSQLWVVDLNDVVSRYDVSTQTPVTKFTAYSNAYGMTWDGQYLWVGTGVGNFYGYDTEGNNVGSFSAPSSYYNAIAFDGQYFLVARAFTNGVSIHRLDYLGSVVETYWYSGSIEEMCWAANHALRGLAGLWISSDGNLTQVSLSDGAATAIQTFPGQDGASYAIAYDGSDLWWGPYSSHTLYQIDDGIDELRVFDVNPVSGVVPAGDSLVIDVAFDAKDLPIDLTEPDYRANIVVNSNDPATPHELLPTHLRVTAAPWIVASDTLLDYGEVIIGESSMDTLTVFNMGTDTLHVSGFTTTLADFVPPAGGLSVPPHDSSDVVVTFAPTVASPLADTLTIQSDAVNEPALAIALAGEGLHPPPMIVVSPDSIADSLLVGETSAHTLTISNTGGLPLDFELSSADTSGPLDWITFGDSSGTVLPDSSVDVVVMFSAVGKIGGDYAGNIVVASNDSILPEVLMPANMHVTGIPVATVSPDTLAWDLTYVGLASVETLLVVNTGTDVLAVTDISPSHADFAPDTTSFDLVPGNGRGIAVMFAPSDSGLYAETLTISSNDPAAPSLGVPLVAYALHPPAVVVAPDSLVDSLFTTQTSVQTFMISNTGGDVLEYVLSIVPPASPSPALAPPSVGWLALGDSAGTVAPGDSVVVDVMFDADNESTGDFGADIAIDTNDPLTPQARVPAHLHVTSAPVIELSDSLLDFGVVFVGTSGDLQLEVRNTGTDSLVVTGITSDLPNVSADPNSFTVQVNELEYVWVSLEGTGDFEQSGTLTIHSNAVNDAAAAVALQATLANPPVLAVAPDTLRDTVRVGVTGTLPFDVMNQGEVSNGSALAFTITSDAPWLWATPDTGSVAPDDTASVAAGYNSAALAGGTHVGNLVVSSNDPFADPDTVGFELTVDNMGPGTLITGVTPDSAVVDTSEVEYSWTGADDMTPTGELEYAYRFDGAGFGAFGPDTSKVFPITAFTEGAHTFEVKARDAVGNEDSTAARRTFFIDRSGPVIAIESGPAQGVHVAVDTASFEWSAVDNFTPPDSIYYRYRFDEDTPVPWPWVRDTTAAFVVEAETLHTFTLEAWDGIDKPGHVSTSARTFTVDRTPPNTEITTTAPQEGDCWPSSSLILQWTGSDNLTPVGSLVFAFRMDDDTLSAYGTAKLHVYSGLAPGTHTFIVMARDLAGNVDATPDTLEFTVGNYDLVPVSIEVPDTVLLDTPFAVGWTGQNAGTCTLDGSWKDKVYLSADSAVGVDDVALSSVLVVDSLAPGGTYSIGNTTTISGVTPGDYWIIVVLDADGGILEESGDANNAIISAKVNIEIPPHPDVVIESIAVPDSGWSGQGVYITWRVRNIGDARATGPWTERVFLATEQTAGETPTMLSDFQFDYNLAPDSSYTHIHPVVFPHDIEGDRWISVCADWTDELEEYAEESNNCAVSDTIFVTLSLFPNLVVDSVAAPVGAEAGETIPIAWYVKNTGGKQTSSPEWYDRVYLNAQTNLTGATALTPLIRNQSYLPPSGDYHQQADVTIPANTPAGSYYLLVRTDVNNQVDEHNDEGDNLWTATTITVSQPTVLHQPNLEAKILVAPNTGWAGIPNEVTYKVTNYGNADAGGSGPTDWILLSADEEPDPDVDLRISGDILGEPLAAVGADTSYYTRTVNVTFPDTSAGPRWLFVWTDVDLIYDDPDLNNNFSLMWDLNILVPPKADLVTSGVFSSIATTVAGATADVYWTVSNHGQGPGTVGSWTDGIYLSSDDSLDVAEDVRLKKVLRSTFLDPDTSYSRSTTVTIPGGTAPGDYYLIVRADEDDQVDEDSLEANNVTVSSAVLHVDEPPAGDLRAHSVSVPEPVYSGTAHDVAWAVTNDGPNPTTTSNWFDRVYISSDSLLDTGSDLLLATAPRIGVLGVDGTYIRNWSVSIPDGYSGPYWVFVVADAGGHVYEAGNEANNTDSTSVTITLTPPPDLRVTELAASDTVDAGDPAAVHWSVANLGVGPTKGSIWYDRFYLSADTVLSTGDTELGTFLRSGALAPGEFYTKDQDISIPSSVSGDRYLIVKTDAVEHIYEHTGEDNNTRWIAVYVVGIPPVPPPDLTMTALSFVDGDKDSLTYTVQNVSTYSIPSSQRSWYDNFYLSEDTTLNTSSDNLIASVYRNTDVAPGPPGYTVTREVTLPNGADGDYYLFGVVDQNQKVTESDELNNRSVIPIHVDLVTTDLQVAGVSAPDTATSGQPIKVAWTVANKDPATTTPTVWYDAVYLSVDKILDATDYSLGTKTHNGALAFNQSYAESLTATVPLGFAGRYYAFVYTDRGNAVYEHAKEDNNFGYGAQGVEIVLPPQSDLVVSGVAVSPDSGAVGDTLDFAWTLANQGTNAVLGEWSDAAYISVDNEWDIGDVLLGKFVHAEPLPAGARVVEHLRISAADFNALLDSELPGLLPGDYRIVVRADIFNNINESDEDNNTGASPNITLDVTPLPFGVKTGFEAAQGDQRYFRVDAAGGHDVRFLFNLDSQFDELEIFTSFGEVPTRLTHEFRAAITGDGDVIVPRTSAGDSLFLLVRGSFIASAGGDSVTAEVVPFGLSSAAPSVVGNAGFAVLSLVGGQLGEVTSVKLSGPGGEEIQAWRVDVQSSTNVSAHFDARGAPAGLYDVVATSSVHGPATLFSAVQVVTGVGPVIVPAVEGPDALRQSASVDYLITLPNSGDADAHDVITGLTIDLGAEYQLIIDGVVGPLQISDGREIYLYNDVIGIGEAGSLSVRMYGTVGFEINVLSVYTEPVFFDLAGDDRVISTWVQAAGAAFDDTLQTIAVTIDSEAFDSLLTKTWTDPAATGVSSPTIMLDDQISQAFVAALDELGDPVVVPDAGDDETSVGLDAAFEKATDIYQASKENPKYTNTRRKVRLRVARDPNEKVGSAELGEDNVVSQVENIPYTIYFENVPTAEAAALQVVVNDALDANLDWRKFRLGEIAFGSKVITVPEELGFYESTVPLDNGLLLEIDAGVDLSTGVATWRFETIDPATGLPPLDPNLGFLPPNDSTGIGQGHVFFTARARADRPDGTEIRNRATIVFDANEAIETNEVVNVLQKVFPDLHVTSSAGSGASASFVEGEPVTITATVANLGESAAGAFNVGFYAGNPSSGGTPIDLTPRLLSLGAGEERSVQTTWTPKRLSGTVDIYVRADHAGVVEEADEANNTRVLAIDVEPRTYDVTLAPDVNLISVPLEPPAPYTARSLAELVGASVIVRCDSSGAFESFVPAEQAGDGFTVAPRQAFIAVVGQAATVTFSGVTHDGAVQYQHGLNPISLPLMPAAPLKARDLATAINANQLIRYNTASGRFEPFIPDFHTGDGFELRGGEGYFALCTRDTFVTHTGTGWLGVQQAQAPWGGSPAPPGEGESSAPVFAVVGAFVEEQWGVAAASNGQFTARATNTRTRAEAMMLVDEDRGTYTCTFVDLYGNAAAVAGDVLHVIVDDRGGKLVTEFDYTVTDKDVERRYTRVDANVAGTPMVTQLFQNFPNPFNPVTTVRYQIATPGRVAIRVYNVRGQLVKTIVDKRHAPGYYQEFWRGDNNQGQSVASGVYFYKLVAPGFTDAKKMVLIR